MLSLRPFQLLQLVHVKLPLIILTDNNWQGEERNRTSDNYRAWVGISVGLTKKPNTPIYCNLPELEAAIALLSVLWPLLDGLQRLRQQFQSFTNTTGKIMLVKILVLHSVKIILITVTAFRSARGFFKLDGTTVPEVPREKHNKAKIFIQLLRAPNPASSEWPRIKWKRPTNDNRATLDVQVPKDPCKDPTFTGATATHSTRRLYCPTRSLMKRRSSELTSCSLLNKLIFNEF